MIAQQGKVVSINGSNALVSIQNDKSCDQCSKSIICAAKLLSKTPSISIENALNAAVGDEVQIGVPEKSLLHLTLVTYLLPLIFMFVVALAVEVLFSHINEVFLIMWALVGLALGLLLVRAYGKKVLMDPSMHPKILCITKHSV